MGEKRVEIKIKIKMLEKKNNEKGNRKLKSDKGMKEILLFSSLL